MAKPKAENTPTAKSDPAPLVAVIRIAGADHKVGDTLDFDGAAVTVETRRHFNATRKSGLASGVYPVVSTMLGPRKAFRAVVDGMLYPIRSYGTEKEAIAKNRVNQSREVSAARGVTGRKHHESLSAGAERLLARYLALKPDAERAAMLSELVVTHLTPAIKNLEATQQAIQALPHDLLARLAEVDEATRERVVALLRGK